QVLPRVVGEDLVEMAIIPLVGDYEIMPEFGAQHPIFKRQVSPTNVTVKDGESLVIGGLISKEKSQRVVGLPVFSHLPIIGNVFKSKVDVVEEKNLLITIKPHILKPREIEGRVKKVFQLKYALAEDMAEKIREVISPQGSIEVNPMEAPPNSIVIKDREDKINLVQLLLNKMGTFEAQRKEKLYKLTFTPVREAETAVEHLLSEKGKVRVIEKENAIVVVDGAYQISLIDSAISVLEDYNSSPRKKFFQLKHITASQALEKLKPFISPHGLVQEVDEKTIVVEDVRIALKRMEKELENIDIPAK
ncbi:hypothetical protein H5U35_04825, partial [Candidatus Aerophobetes bacterium]|nr:hypothetical protein [Candidatus Aerophobetes bacterium]